MIAWRGVLDPLERVSEALFGLITVLTFTCSISAAEAGSDDVRTMIYAALGCNLAWAIIDALMYLMARLSERGRDLATVRRVQRAHDAEEGRRIIARALPESVTSVLETEGLEQVRERLQRLPEALPRPRLVARDWLGATAVFLWVLAITFPVVIPFLFIREPLPALRISNLVAVVLLFVAGCSFGRWSGLRPWATGIAMVIVGTVVVAVTIALGG